MIVAIHQPNYVPWLGYFHKMAAADVFVLLDDVQFTKNSFINRVRVLGPNGPRWLSVPVTVSFGDPIMAVMPAQPDWASRHRDILRQAYRRAPAFEAVWPEISALYASAPVADLATVNRHFIDGLGARLAIETKILLSSEIETGDASGTERLTRIVSAVAPGGIYLSGQGGGKYQDEAAFKAAGIRLHYAQFCHPRYDQLTSEFVEGLSVLDAVFFLGWNETRAILKTA